MINPALVPLLLLCLAPLFARRRAAAVAAVLCGAAGILLLARALAIPDGVPGPAAVLAEHPPWQSVAMPDGGNPAQADVAYQIYPWLLYERAELRSGRLPLWNPFQYSGTPFWSNGQAAPLFPLHLLFGLLPVQLGLVLLPWARVVVGGLGAWALGRELGLSRTAALVPALVLPLSGMYVSFLLFPMANALALVPWVLWATERLTVQRSRWPLLAALVGLQLLAGHPETALHTALLSVLYLAVRGAPAIAWRRWALAWSVGAGVAAIQLLPFLGMLAQSPRWQAAAGGAEPALGVLLAQPLRLLLPALYGDPALGTWWGPFNYLATAVYAGAATLPLAWCGARAQAADRRVRALVWMLVFSVAAAYHLPGLRDLLGALPILGKAAHHRLIFGIELTLALLAGAGLDRWRAGRRAGLGWGVGLTIGGLAAAWWRFGPEWSARHTLGEQARWSAWVLACALGLWLLARLNEDGRRRVALALPVLLGADLLVAHGRLNPALPAAALYPRTGAIDFLQAQARRADDGRVAGTASALRPNAAMVYRLRDLRGDDSMKLGHYERLYADRLGEGHPTYYRPLRAWSEPWLDELGLRWVLAGPAEPAPVASWRLAYQGDDARVFERAGARSLARFGQPVDGGELRVLSAAPGDWRIAWRSVGPARIVVAEAWDAGWRADLDGRGVPVEREREHLLGVEVGGGAGVLRLRYAPAGLWLGAALSAGALGALGFGLWWRR